MNFETRYKTLNPAQQSAVDQIDGPVMVIAGPGTGKTELLSMRVANILNKTDTLPRNILCLTFTESGAEAMRTRLASIIGPSAYEVAIHTFHSFGSEVIANNREYFYRGAEFRPADDITSMEILTHIFDELDYTNPLSSKMNDEYTYLRDAKKTISELKRSGLTSDELLRLLDVGDETIDNVEPKLQQIFANRVSLAMVAPLTKLATEIAALPSPTLPRGISPLNHVMALSLAHAVDEAEELHSTKPLTAWKSTWLTKDASRNTVLKDRRRHEVLRQMSFVYYRYLAELEKANLYDFDDMILSVVHAMETQPDLKANLQEMYQFILVDEFQDTNLAQARLLLNLIDNSVHEGHPNIMTVGDDDQAIYSFQGADVGNMRQFLHEFPATKKIILTENYRSAPAILALSRDVIQLGDDRLERHDATLNKELVANYKPNNSQLRIQESATIADQYTTLAAHIADDIQSGIPLESIAVLARKHTELEALVPFLAQKNIYANYERQNNLLDLDIIRTLVLMGNILRAFHAAKLDHADSLLPELLCHPSLAIDPTVIWRMSLKAYTEKRTWSELLSVTPELESLHNWIITTSVAYSHTSCEHMIDLILGTQEGSESPFRTYFFGTDLRTEHPERLLENIHGIEELYRRVRSHLESQNIHASTFDELLDFVSLYKKFNQKITLTQPATTTATGLLHLMTTHKAKGLEFEKVYIINADDNTWGAKVRGASSKISYPENLPLAPHTGSRDEQIRLLYVALTRAKTQLQLSFATIGKTNKPQSLSDLLLVDHAPNRTKAAEKNLDTHIADQEQSWQTRLLAAPKQDIAILLEPYLSRYRLSATHVNNFVDLTRGGPEHFLLQNLLHLPQSFAPNAAYGTAIHEALQLAQTHLAATKSHKPLEDTLRDFEMIFTRFAFDETTMNFFLQRGGSALQKFLASDYTGFTPTAKAEFNFAYQNVCIDGARLNGKIDLIQTNAHEKTVSIIDYKTGKSAVSWQGKTDDEKIKLHKYRQQLMFYRLLIEHSREFTGYTWHSGALQFVEPDKSGVVLPPLVAAFSDEDYHHFTQLVHAIWQCIQSLDLPDSSHLSQDYKGILAFEQELIDKYAKR